MPVVIGSWEPAVKAFVEKLFVEWNDVICLLFGSLCILGAIRDWDWLCDPTGKPHAPLLTRGLLRASSSCSEPFWSSAACGFYSKGRIEEGR